jgi:tetratricopeptide (TPR) repeat protein
MSHKLLGYMSLSFAILGSSVAVSDELQLQTVQKEWALCQYNTADDDEKEQCFDALISKNIQYLSTSPNNAELTVWLAINKASLAGAKGGLGALSLAEEAKELLEQVIETSPTTLNGSAYTSLGSLYYKVPGWPIGFGDDDKAEEMLKKALEINPNGIDPNYFYGDFLAQDGRKKEAKAYLMKALQAEPRLHRQLADEGRKKDIEITMARIK